VSKLPTWSEILTELKELRPEHGPAAFDIVRRKYLAELQQYTKRNTIIYTSAWTQKPKVQPEDLSITDEDMQGLMEVVHGLSSDPLDLILHSPGGSAEATEALVYYIRSKFSDLRVIVPHKAMSAATMLACCADKIVMGRHSFLGPIDPQFFLRTHLGIQSVPAQAILDQFDMAKRDCQDPRRLGAWAPMLPQYGPALLIQCQETLKLSKELVAKWLGQYMFRYYDNPWEKAAAVAESLADHTAFKTHGRPIDRDYARRLGLHVDDLEKDQKLQDLVLSVFHATSHTFGGTDAVKIIENHQGRAFVRRVMVVTLPTEIRMPGQRPPKEAPPPGSPPAQPS
jgi:hypothetical protein